VDDPITWLRTRIDDDEARYSAEVAAKRRLLEVHRLYNTGAGDCCETCSDVDESGQAHGRWLCETLRLQISPYAGHSGCQPEWLPE